MSSIPSADAKAVVTAVAGLTTQVRRIADALSTPVVEQTDAADDGPTTPATTCSAPGPWGDAHACWLPAEHDGDHQGHDGCTWCGGETNEPPAADEDAQRTARRDSLRILLGRLDRTTTGTDFFTGDEAGLLRQHVDAEIREADTARSVATGNKRHVQVMYEELEQANEAARRALEQRQEMARERHTIQEQRDTADRIRAEVQRDRDQHAAVLNEVLDSFRRIRTGQGFVVAYQGGNVDPDTFDGWRSVVAPTAERPWWQTVAEVRAELEEAQAATERVRDCLADLERAGWSQAAIARRIRAALDGTEQPTESS
jgi:hypothetical protein